jgi:hypothetical protein
MVIFCGSLKIITNSKNRTTQDFRIVSSYVTIFKGKMSSLEFGNFDLDKVIGLELTGLS